MAIEVKIPAVGESITSGVVSVWHKKSGEFVNEGESLFTLETDKVSTEIVAEKAGVLETKVPEGQEVKIGEVVATIEDSTQQLKEKKLEPEKISSTGKGGRLTKADVLHPAQRRETAGEAMSFPGTATPSATVAEPSADGRFTRKRMSPLRRKIAQQLVMAQHTAAI